MTRHAKRSRYASIMIWGMWAVGMLTLFSQSYGFAYVALGTFAAIHTLYVLYHLTTSVLTMQVGRH